MQSTILTVITLVVLSTWSSYLYAKDTTIKVGVLQFGTINWEMSLIQQMKLDAKHGFTLEVVPVASKNAAAVALQAGAVDVILTDIFWVLHQYNAGKDYVIMPTHKATGGIYARAQSADSFSLNDLSGRRLGVAGGSTDKNYIILNAFAKAEDTSLANVDVKFAAPPLLKRMLEQEQIDYSINFWHYNARLAAQGFVNVLPLTTMLERLDINTDVPLLGWVASAAWLAQNNHIFSGFVAASAAAKQRLVKDQSAWEAVRHLTKAESNEIFASLIAHYPQTLLTSFDRSNQQAFASLVSRLADAQQVAFLGEITHIPQDIYWQSAIGVWEQRGNNP